MTETFPYDVFLSHNSEDKPRVRRLGKRLSENGLQVWFDDWIIKPGDDIYMAIEHGLEQSRVLLLFLSPAALGSGWVTLERSTVLFRDPVNAGRRFIPVLMRDCKIPDALRRYKYIDYRRETASNFAKLLKACEGRREQASKVSIPAISLDRHLESQSAENENIGASPEVQVQRRAAQKRARKQHIGMSAELPQDALSQNVVSATKLSADVKVAVQTDGREYLLLLDIKMFTGAPSNKLASQFWQRRVKPIVDKCLGVKRSGSTRAHGDLAFGKARSVTFLDTKERLLSRNGFALRERVVMEDGTAAGGSELTLMFRPSDFVLAAEYFRAANEFRGGTRLVEQFRPVLRALPVTTYSHFLVSTKIRLDVKPERLEDVLDQFEIRNGKLNLKYGHADQEARLNAGRAICEFNCAGAVVDLGEGCDAKFGLSLWYLSEGWASEKLYSRAISGSVDPGVAEVCFDLDREGLNGALSERATRLFNAMQQRLPVDLTASSKVALVLPFQA